MWFICRPWLRYSPGSSLFSPLEMFQILLHSNSHHYLHNNWSYHERSSASSVMDITQAWMWRLWMFLEWLIYLENVMFLMSLSRAWIMNSSNLCWEQSLDKTRDGGMWQDEANILSTTHYLIQIQAARKRESIWTVQNIYIRSGTLTLAWIQMDADPGSQKWTQSGSV